MPNWNGATASRAEVRELKRQAALKVAAHYFNEKGFHGTSLDQVAEDVGVTKTALYYYFKSKDQLLFECIKLNYDCGQIAMREAEALDAPAIDRLKFLYRRFTILLMESRGAYPTMANIHALPPDLREELLKRRQRLDRFSRLLIARAIEEGALRDMDVRLSSNFFLGAATWILRWQREDEETPAEDIAEHFLDLFLHGAALRTGLPER